MVYRIVIGILILGCTLCSCSITMLGRTEYTESYADGVYVGEFFQFPNSARVKVTIENSRITEVVLLDRGGTWVGDAANEVIPRRIVENQSTSVDAVSGATRSSLAIMNAAHNAIVQASKKGQPVINSEN